ncbi:MAG: ABC transporter ATP-binding protein [Fastidiosipila sp.]|jgi:ATP-binding cassette subfamily B protein|nr:ABC transporter ATP-binding protein [Fastidiosipila sp.]
MQEDPPRTLYQLMWSRKRGFIIYLFAAFLPIFQQLIMEAALGFSFTLLEARTKAEISVRIAILVAAMLVPSVFHWISRRLRIGFMRDILLDVRKRGFRHILSLPVRVFSRKSRDHYLSLLVNDLNIFENDFFVSFLNVIFNGGLTLIALGILFFFDWRYGLASTLATGLLALLGRGFQKKIVSLKEKESDANKDFSQQMSNVFRGLEILKLNQVEAPFREKSMGYVTALENIKMRFNIFDYFQSGTMETLGLIFTVLSFFYIGTGLVSARLSLPQGVFMVQITQRAIWGMVQVFPHLNKVRASQAIFDRIVRGSPDEQEAPAPLGTLPFTLNQGIEVDQLSFSYDNRPVLQRASFKINKGEKVLLRGISGSGKTTLLNLLAGVYSSYGGEIRYDGRELRTIDPAPLNRRIAEVYQDVFLFEDTLQNNITLFSDYGQEAIEAAVDRAGLRELVERLPLGLETPLEENGKNLSGGERQRVSIARAILKQASLLLADEATSNLDENLGRHIEATLLSLDATVISISHRYYEGVTEGYDKILEIDGGTISVWQPGDYFKEAG